MKKSWQFWTPGHLFYPHLLNLLNSFCFLATFDIALPQPTKNHLILLAWHRLAINICTQRPITQTLNDSVVDPSIIYCHPFLMAASRLCSRTTCSLTIPNALSLMKSQRKNGLIFLTEINILTFIKKTQNEKPCRIFCFVLFLVLPWCPISINCGVKERKYHRDIGVLLKVGISIWHIPAFQFPQF